MLRLILVGLVVVFSFLGSGAFGDPWDRVDNRIKGKTQQCRPVEPIEFFAIKPVKG